MLDIILKWILQPLMKPIIEFINTGLFTSAFQNIFFIERQIGLPTATIDMMNNYIAYIAGLLLTLKLLHKLFIVYVIKTDGDATVKPIDYLKSYVKGLIVILTFTVAYGWIHSIVSDIANTLSKFVGNNDFPVDATGTTTFIFLIIYLILIVVIYIHFLMNGVRLFILRMSMPFACVGLIDNDNGLYAVFMKKIFQTCATIIVQMILVQISIFPILKIDSSSIYPILNYMVSIAIVAYCLKVTQDLSEIFLTSGASGMGNKASALGRGAMNAIKFIKK
ncbi:DUF6102 family protein [Paludicola sp. MB14-C6]|uniref:conjugal transfer protein TrbL family protein n=1 Tax=Paludihabitans sp. MB14-C6 TaxID=3070656 RepID=UPI0027DC7FF5|nr:conjugal transfer protein TrbL family protein [Paludicola sp. MB14-C6]WMJ24298.1 DUF6102 family protein [Paludicola sp. MB14-C6]